MAKRVRKTVSRNEAKTHLPSRVKRTPGKGRGMWHVKRGFDKPLPADVMSDFER